MPAKASAVREGVDSPTGPGGNGNQGTLYGGGGGGGAGAVGGDGGTGDVGHTGGTGGINPGDSGNPGAAAAGVAGGGGGGAHGSVNTALPVAASTGGAGGAGGSGDTDGGGGGAGGFGAVVTGAGNLGTLGVAVTGGQGGVGGAGGIGYGGNGGSGGTGLLFTDTTGVTVTVNAAVQGGNGGAGGTGATNNGAAGPGGAGVVGSNLQITLDAAGSIAGGGGANALTLSGLNSLTFTNAGAAALTGDIGVTGTAQLNAAVGGTTVSNAITGSGGLIQNSANTLTLSGTNTYSGGTTFNSGTLSISSDANLGNASGGLTFNGGTLQFGSAFDLASTRAITLNAGGGTFDIGGNTTTFSQSFGGSGPVTFANGGAVLSAVNTYSGATTITSSGFLNANTTGALSANSDFTVNGQLDLNGFNNTIKSLSGSGLVANSLFPGSAATLTIAPASGVTTFSGTITDGPSGALSLTKTGAGTEVLSGANGYSGATTISAGVLNIQNGGALGATTFGTTVASGAALELQGGITVASEALTLNGTGGANGGALRSVSGNNTYNGPITLGSDARINADADELDINGGIGGAGQNLSFGAQSGAAIAVSGAIATGTGTLTKDGDGLLALQGINSYTGVTTVNAGTLRLAGSAAIADTGAVVVNAAGSLGVENSETIGSLAGSGNIGIGFVFGPTTLTTGGDNTSTLYSGVIGEGADPGSLVKTGAGIFTLSGANTYGGGTTFAGGILNAGSAGALGTTGTLSFTGGTLQYSAANQTDYSGRFSPVAGQAYSIDTNGQTVTYASALTSAGGSLTKLGTGTLILTAANTYTGTTDVNAGTLTITGSIGSVGTPAGAIGVLAGATLSVGAGGSVNIAGHNLTNAGTVTVASGGSITDDLVNSGTVSNAGTYTAKVASNTGTITNTNIWNGDVLSNAGSLVNAAGAIWTGNISSGGSFSNAGIITGTLTNTAGTTTNNGSISGAVIVSGGTFKGTGSSGGLAIGSGAVFAPGNGTPGTSATVNGSLAFSAGAFYQVAINPTTASFVNATGTATLGGASVQAFFSSGSYVAKQYTILNATGGVSGTFNTLASTNLPSGFTSTLSYDGTHAYLDLALNFTPGPDFSGGLTINQRNVATTLVNFFNSNGSIPIVFGALTPAGLTQASGELATATQQTSFDAMNLFMGVMTDPFAGGRGDGAASSGGAIGYADAAKRKPNDALAAITTKARPMTPTFEQRWSTWVAGYGGAQSTDGNAALGSNNTTSSVYGTAVGADYRLSPSTLAGFALAGGGTNFNVNGSGYGRSDLFQAGAFIRHTHGPAYITGALAYGWQDITTNRTVMVAGLDKLRAEFNANTWSGRVEGGYRFVAPVFGGFGLTPYAAGQVTTFDLPSYTESVLAGAGAFALSYNARSVTDTRSELGFRTDKSYAMETGILTLRGRTAWAHDFNPDRSIAATFQTLPGASFVVNGAAQAPDSLLSSEAIEFKWANGWSVAATFDSEYSSVATSYAGKGVLRYTW